MAYRLSLDAPLDQSIRQIAIEQLDEAISVLQTSGDKSKSVHSARRAFKRTRALLHLAKAHLKPKTFKRENSRIAAVARELSDARDAQVMYDTAAKMQAALPSDAPLLAHLVSLLKARLERTESGLAAGRIAAAVEDLGHARQDIAQLEFENAGIGSLLQSARKTYALGRKHMKIALAGGDDETCHEWRKLVQRHWRHTRLFHEAWPDEAKARSALARNLAQTLGEHHDLAILRAAIEGNGALFARRRDVLRLVSLIQDSQAGLLRQAALDGERLYAEKPKNYLHRMTVYWETAKQGRVKSAPEPVLAAA